MEELKRWQKAVNLVSQATLEDVGERHVDDSLQLAELEPQARSWLDLGSGGGLPGLIIAAAQPAARVDLVESDGRKCAFLRSTAHLMGVAVDVHETRIETFRPPPTSAPAVITARGLASLARLLAYAQPLLVPETICLFPKGRGYVEELTAARESWTFTADIVESRTDMNARIVRIAGLRPASTDQGGFGAR